MIATAVFAAAALLSPAISGSILHRISTRGPRAATGGLLAPSMALVLFVAAIGSFLADADLVKLVLLTTSGLATLITLPMSAVFVAYPSEFCEETL